MGSRMTGIKDKINKIKKSEKAKNFSVFLVFVCIAAIFWFIITLNDEVQENFEIGVQIDNVPDSVTFITMPPSKIHVVVRAKGGILVQHVFSGKKALHFNFEEFESDNRFVVTRNTLNSSLRHLFGSDAVISSMTPDSISLLFTKLPGRELPVELTYDVTAAPGMVVLPNPELSQNTTLLYSTERIDTISRIFTQKVVLRNLDKTTTVSVPLVPLPGTRLKPGSVNVTFSVEQMVRKESEVPVTVDKLPPGKDILFFPARVKVAYYVPMSLYNADVSGLKVEASYSDALYSPTEKVAVKITGKPSYMSQVELLTDSVEYSLVSGN